MTDVNGGSRLGLDHQKETHAMAQASTPRRSRSGSRSTPNPKTKTQRLTRVQELTRSIDHHLAEAQAKGEERNRIVGQLREVDHATFREIAAAAGKSEQAIHKAFTKNGHAKG